MEVIFTQHVKERLVKREITEKEVIDAVCYPDRLYHSQGKYFAQKNSGRGKIEVVYEKIVNKSKYLNIITVYWL
ncbi:MAG: DUF4258 domain-containing protein [Nanoarchaeota archaeon]